MRAPVVTVATTEAEIEALRPRWSEFDAANIDCDIDYFLTLVRNADNVIAPYVVLIERDGGNLLLVARVEKQTLPLTLFYRRLAAFEIKALVIAFDGFLGARDPQDEKMLMQAVCGALEAGRADIAVFQAVDAEGSLLAAAQGSLAWWRRSHWNQIAPRWKADVGGKAEAVFGKRSAKTRKRYQAQDRKLEGLYGSRLVLRREKDFAHPAELFRDLEQVAAQSYQRRLGAGFTNSALDRALIAFGLGTGAFRAWLLYIDGVPIAHWTGTAHRGTFAIGTPAFDPSYTKDSVGRYTMFRMIGDLCDDPAMDTLDFGFGDAEYKSAFGSAAKEETRLVLAAGRPRPSLIVLLYSLTQLINLCAKSLLKRLSHGDRLKTIWRSRAGKPGRKTGGAVAGEQMPEASRWQAAKGS
jgi:CelD/BcsL family acetyltransferase involved in cellulose biosynthesis